MACSVQAGHDLNSRWKKLSDLLGKTRTRLVVGIEQFRAVSKFEIDAGMATTIYVPSTEYFSALMDEDSSTAVEEALAMLKEYRKLLSGRHMTQVLE